MNGFELGRGESVAAMIPAVEAPATFGRMPLVPW
jgi:hypothetical protein